MTFRGNLKKFLKKNINKVEKKLGLKNDKKQKTSIEKISSDIQELTSQELPKKEKTTISLDTWSIVRFWFFWVLFVWVWYLLTSTINIIIIVLTAFILSITIESLILFFSKFMKRWFAMFLSYILLLVFLIVIILFAIIVMVKQSQFLIPLAIDLFVNTKNFLLTSSPEQFANSISWLPKPFQQEVLSFLNETNLFNQLVDASKTNIDTLISFAKISVNNVTWFLTSFVSSFAKTLTNFLLVFVLAILFSSEKNWIINFLSSIWWSETKTRFRYKIEVLYKKLWQRIRWQFILMFLVGLMTWIWLSLISLFWLDIQWTWSLAILVWFLDAIPYVWPFLGSIPVILVWIKWSWLIWGLTVLILFVIIQQIESNILVPVVMEKSVWVSSALVFICMLIGWFLLGILGVFLAVPFAVILTLLFSNKFKL